MSLVINPSVAPVSAQGVTSDVVLQPGTVVSAQVLQILDDSQVRIAIGGQSIDVLTQVPLQAGQTLQLAVSQTADSIQLAVVNPQPGAAAAQGAGDVAGSIDQVTLAPTATAPIQAQPALSAAAPLNALTPQEQAAVSAAAQIAATQQASLAPLFANLTVAAGLPGLPPQVQQAVAQVLAQQTSLDPALTGADVEQAFQSSGLLLEAHLASGPAPSTAAPDLKAALVVLRQVLTTAIDGAGVAPGATTAVQSGTSPAVPPGTAPRLVLVPQLDAVPAPAVPGQGIEPQQLVGPARANLTLVSETPAASSPTLAPEIGSAQAALGGLASPAVADELFDFSAVQRPVQPPLTPADAAARAAATTEGLSLLQETLQAAPQTVLNGAALAFDDGLMLSLLPAVTGSRPRTVDDPSFARSNVPPPPVAGALPSAQPVLPATLVSNAPAGSVLHHLLGDTDGAIARQTLLQVASLPDRVDTTSARPDGPVPRWNFEIPFATPQGTAVAQFEISRDGGGNPAEPGKRVWRARFSLDVEPAGPVHALISLSGDKTSVRMWAERPQTAAQLRAGATQLSQALARADLKPGDIVIQDGAPVQAAPAAAGHFLDRAL
jgi:hypothetical protein